MTTNIRTVSEIPDARIYCQLPIPAGEDTYYCVLPKGHDGDCVGYESEQ